MPEPETDVIIIGGGPAGSATAAMLALSGARVRLIERERFPRYSVGESLIPFCYYDLEKIGVLDAVRRAGFVRKVSVQFIRPDGSDTHPFYFDQHLTGEAAVTWQVDRGKFDAILLDHARSCGVEIIEDCEVRKIEQSDSGSVIGVTALDPAGVERFLPARITVDASGRRGLAMHQMGWFIPDPQLRKVALWTYVRGAVRDPGRDEGATTVAYVGGKNWFWWIPLADDRVSVGIVGDAD